MSPRTPGPWVVSAMTPTRVDTIDGSFSISWGGHGEFAYPRERRAEANARLIAAAPDLLEALKSLVALSEAAAPGEGFDTAEAEAAISKAIGEA